MTEVKESAIRTVINLVLEREGGIAQNPTEPYVTRWGQTPGWLERWRLPVPTSADEAGMNYRSWLEQTRLDELCTEDDALPDVVVDFAVNSGERVAIAALQRALRVKADGVIGVVTLAALDKADRREIAQQVLADRIELDCGLVANHPDTYLVYLRGWSHRLADHVRRLS